jgi:hypothetical protein
MKKKPFELLNRLDDLPTLKPNESKSYNYQEKKGKVIASYSLNSVLVDKIERMSYWEHFGKSALVEAILERYFNDKDFEEIPKRILP